MSRYQAELEAHLEKYAGPIEVRYENLLAVRATPERACHIVVTTDLSDEPMESPKSEWAFAELCVLLPAEWPLDPEAWTSDLAIGWPMWELQRLVRYARESKSWLGFGHTIPNGNPPQPFAPPTQQCCSFLIPPLEMPEKFARLRLADNEILNFWAIVPIYRDELALKINQKAASLIQRLGQKGVSDILNPTRPGIFDKPVEPPRKKKIAES